MANPNSTGPSLADVDRALANNGLLPPTRRRDLRSAISRVAALLCEDPARLPLDLAAIAGRLAGINPVAAGLTPKTLSNIRSDLLAAVRMSGLQPVLASSKAALSPPWADFGRRPERIFVNADGRPKSQAITGESWILRSPRNCRRGSTSTSKNSESASPVPTPTTAFGLRIRVEPWITGVSTTWSVAAHVRRLASRSICIASASPQ